LLLLQFSSNSLGLVVQLNFQGFWIRDFNPGKPLPRIVRVRSSKQPWGAAEYTGQGEEDNSGLLRVVPLLAFDDLEASFIEGTVVIDGGEAYKLSRVKSGCAEVDKDGDWANMVAGNAEVIIHVDDVV
jgi:hypothetical protein